jgi:PAS domain S-box-containing protein
VIVLGSLLGVGFLVVAGFTVNRQIGVSAWGRAQVIALNADLEQRVAQRTAALQAEMAEHAKSAELLRTSEEWFRLLLDGIKDYAVYMLDPQGLVISWNAGAASIKGYQAGEILGKHFSCFYTAAEQKRGKPQQELLEAVANGRYAEEGNRVRKDGSVFWASVVIAPMWDTAGALRGYSNVSRDISDRKRAEEKLAGQAEELARQAVEVERSGVLLRSQARMLQLVLDSMGEGLVAADEHGQFVIWNPAAEKILGRGPDKVPSEEWAKHYQTYLTDGVTPCPTAQLPLVRALAGESSQAELIVGNPVTGENIWIEVVGHPLWGETGASQGGVVAIRDITRRKADEREIQTLNQDLEQRVVQRTAQLEAANRELEAFTYSVSHDLRAPLRHIGGFANILMEDFGSSLPADAQKHVERIEEGARKMGQLVDELLSLAHLGRQALTVQPTGLSSIVKDVLTLLTPESEGRQVEWRIAALPFVECDPGLVRQVFQNLISNALKYSRPRSPAVIEIGSMKKDGQLVIFVRDNGVGFSMKYADKLFGVFQRLHRAEEFEGTGVGLATVQRIIHRHGGRIWADAELDQGATFYFTLGSVDQPETMKNAAASAGG